MEYTIAMLERVRARLAALPTPDRRSKQLNKQDSIGFLAKDLIASMRNGHTLDQLAGVLAAEGVSMSPVAIKSHLRRVRVRGRKKRRGSRPSARERAVAKPNGDSKGEKAPETRQASATKGGLKEQSGASLRLPGEPGSLFAPRKDSDKI